MLGFDIGPIRAVNRNEMKATLKLHDLDQSIWLDSFTRGLRSSQTHGLFTDVLAVTVRATAMQIGRQEK
jgi:hypothetical protein